MRRLSLLFAVLFVIPLFGSDSPKEYDGMMEATGIEGTWRLTDFEFLGQKSQPFNLVVMTLRSGNYTLDNGDGDPWRGRYSTDATQKPSHFDLLPSNRHKGKMIKWIFQIDGDILRIAFIADVDDTPRPKGFNDKHVYVEIFKRVK